MGEEYVILNKDKICFCSHSLTFPAVSALPVADSGKADGVSEAMPPNTVYPIASDSGFSPFKQQYNKKKFGSSQILVQYHIIATRSVFFNKVLFKKLAVVPENSKFIVTIKKQSLQWKQSLTSAIL